MKKLLSIILCFSVIFGNITMINAFASENSAPLPTVTVSCADNCKAGERLTVTVDLSNASDYCGISFGLVYDNQKFAVNSYTAGTAFIGLGNVTPKGDNQVYMNYVNMTPKSDNGNLMTVVFDVLNSAFGTAEFGITDLKLKDVSYGNIKSTYVSDSTEIEGLPKPTVTVNIEELQVSTGDELTVDVSLSNASDYCGISFGLTYDNSKFDVESYTAGSSFIGLGNITQKGDNQVYMNYINMTPKSDNGVLMTVVFKAKENVAGKSDFTITDMKLKDVSYSNIESNSVNDSVNIICTHKGVEWKQTKEPNCKEKGLKEYECACGYYDSEEIPKGSHSYQPTVVPPAKDTDGYTIHTCSGCGDTYTDTFVDALGYDVIFDANGGMFDVDKQNKRPNTNLILTSKIPVRTGYTFKGWAKSSTATTADFSAGAAYSVNEDVKLYAVWQINTHKLTYTVDGKTYKEYNVVYDSSITPEPIPVKEGHTFSGWSTIPSKMPDEDVNVTGEFSVNQHNLIYKVDGKEYKKTSLSYGSSIIPETEPQKEGYTFSGWSTVPKTMPDEDVTITGTFSVNSYKLIYKIDGEEYSSESVVYGTTLIAKSNPEKEGYTFSGWSDIPKTMPAKDVTITGTFSVNSYKLIYKVDGEEYSSESVAYGTALTAKSNPEKEGHTFSGWSEVPTAMPAKDVTITGTFSINSYKLVYKVDGEEYSSEDVVYGTVLVPKAEPVKKGYTFSGWSMIPSTMPAKDVEISGKFTLGNYKLVYKVDGKVYKTIAYGFNADIVPEASPEKEGYTFSGWSTIPSKMPANDVTVTGTFTVNKYKLIYKLDGEEYSNEDIAYGTNLVSKTSPVKEGYTFSGWSEVPATMPARNVTITGTFNINTYKLIYKVEGVEYKTSLYDYGAAITPEPAFEKEGYIFVNWENIPEKMPASDVIVNAVLKKVYKLSGKVFFNDMAAADIDISINDIHVTPNEKGEYVIEKLPAGTYNITFEKGAAKITQTILVDGSDVVMKDVKLTTLIINEDYAESKVAAIETLGEEFNDKDKAYVSENDFNIVTINAKATKKTFDSLENAEEIKKAIPNGYKSNLYYFDVDVSKAYAGDETTEISIIDSTVLHKIIVELPDTMKNKQAYTVIRNIDGVIDTLTTTENADGEKIEVSGNKIYIYTKAMDGFAVSYKQKSTGGGYSGSISRAAAVTANISSGEVLIGTKIELKTSTSNAAIYYTLDGSVPTENSTVYSEPIVLTDNVVINAIAVKKGMTDSKTATFEYVVKQAEIKIGKPEKYIDAYEDGTFKPDNAITRYEVITALNNVFSIQKTDLDITFNDVDEKYADLVKLFAGAYVINGYEDGTFRGNME